MYLIDTNVISELRKKPPGSEGARPLTPIVLALFNNFQKDGSPLYLSSITIGELQRGIALCRRRGDTQQATVLERWLDTIVADFNGNILPFCAQCARVWGHLCAPDNTNVLDKKLAATALVYDLTLVTRNVRHVEKTGVKVLNPFVR